MPRPTEPPLPDVRDEIAAAQLLALWTGYRADVAGYTASLAVTVARSDRGYEARPGDVKTLDELEARVEQAGARLGTAMREVLEEVAHSHGREDPDAVAVGCVQGLVLGQTVTLSDVRRVIRAAT